MKTGEGNGQEKAEIEICAFCLCVEKSGKKLCGLHKSGESPSRACHVGLKIVTLVTVNPDYKTENSIPRNGRKVLIIFLIYHKYNSK